MKRQGKYTRRPNRLRRTRTAAKHRWLWFWRLSRRQKVTVIAIPILLFLVLVPLVTYLMLARDIADPERLMNRNNTGVELLDKNGEVFYSTGSSKPLKRLALSEIADSIEQAVISSEDKDFYKHSGVSIRGLVAALYANAASRDATAYGGSTLTQQLVKNTLLTSNKTFFRKYQELAMAIAVDRRYSKDEILDMYLNSVYYGEGAFGIDDAAHTYFGKQARDLSLAESSMLIGILPAPSAYSPISGDPAKAKKQQERVLRRMVEDGKISEADKQTALTTELTYAPPKSDEPVVAPHYVEMVIAELNEKYGEETVKRSGYRVTTTLDLTRQKEIEQIVVDQTAINARGGGRNTAVVAIDPRNGEIRALVGSADYNNAEWGKVNVALTARQPGSSFKPIYTAEALNQKLLTASTMLKDEPTTFGDWKPNNYDFKFRGDISLRSAISQSLNIPMIKTMQKLGVEKSVKAAERMGISTISQEDGQRLGLSLALGAGEARPLEMTNAYAAFAHEGQQYETTTIQTIKSKYDDIIYRHQLKPERVQSAEASYIISSILSDNAARAPTFGSSLNISGHTVAVKTGSTDNNHDAWTIGYTPSITVGVWVGNNENVAMTSGGSAMAGPIWRKSMIALLGDSSNEQFARPSGVVEVSVCRSNGLRATGSGTAGTYKEVFISGTVPSGSCTTKQETAPAEDTANQQPTQVARDSDGDGVTDDKDLCPNTPRSMSVSANGCAVSAATDSDSDGVVDSDDDCSGTAADVNVDDNGCPVVEPPTNGNGTNPVTPPVTGGWVIAWWRSLLR